MITCQKVAAGPGGLRLMRGTLGDAVAIHAAFPVSVASTRSRLWVLPISVATRCAIAASMI